MQRKGTLSTHIALNMAQIFFLFSYCVHKDVHENTLRYTRGCDTQFAILHVLHPKQKVGAALFWNSLLVQVWYGNESSPHPYAHTWHAKSPSGSAAAQTPSAAVETWNICCGCFCLNCRLVTTGYMLLHSKHTLVQHPNETLNKASCWFAHSILTTSHMSVIWRFYAKDAPDSLFVWNKSATNVTFFRTTLSLDSWILSLCFHWSVSRDFCLSFCVCTGEISYSAS